MNPEYVEKAIECFVTLQLIKKTGNRFVIQQWGIQEVMFDATS
jgi:hypothetical protein